MSNRLRQAALHSLSVRNPLSSALLVDWKVNIQLDATAWEFQYLGNSVMSCVCVVLFRMYVCRMGQGTVKELQPGWSTAATAGLSSACLHPFPVPAGNDGSSAARK